LTTKAGLQSRAGTVHLSGFTEWESDYAVFLRKQTESQVNRFGSTQGAKSAETNGQNRQPLSGLRSIPETGAKEESTWDRGREAPLKNGSEKTLVQTSTENTRRNPVIKTVARSR